VRGGGRRGVRIAVSSSTRGTGRERGRGKAPEEIAMTPKNAAEPTVASTRAASPGARSRALRALGAAGLALVLAACGDDDAPMPMPMPDAALADTGVPDTGAPDAGDPDAGPGDAGPSDAGASDADPGDAGRADGGVDCTPTALLVTTSDFRAGQRAVIDVATQTVVAGPVASDDQDTVPVRTDCDSWLVEGGTGDLKLQVRGMPLDTARVFDLDPPGTPASTTYASTPQFVVDATGHLIASRYSLSSLAVLDLAAGAVAATIDLSPLAAPTDPDAVDASAMAVVGPRVVVALGRFYFPAPTFSLTYAGPSVLAVVDPVARALVDVDPAAPGVQGVVLPTGNPTALLTLDDDTVLVACKDDAFVDTDGALYSVDVPTGTVSDALVREADVGGFGRLLRTDDGRVLLGAGGGVREIDPSSGMTRRVIVPSGTARENLVALVGDRLFVATGAGLRSWSVATGTETTPASGPIAVGALPFYGLAPAR
jgi:hypothetical protein